MKENTAYINKVTLKQRLAAYRHRPTSFIMFLITWAAIASLLSFWVYRLG